MRDVGHVHPLGVEIRTPIEAHDLAPGLCPEVRCLDSHVVPRAGGVLPDVEHVAQHVPVAAPCVVSDPVLHHVGVVRAPLREPVEHLVATDVVEGFELVAVLPHLPGKEVAHVVAAHRRAGQQVRPTLARLREYLRAVVQRYRLGGLVRPVGHADGPVVVPAVQDVEVRVLVALQVVPLGEDYAAERVDDRREGARRAVREDAEPARRGVEQPDSGDDRPYVVLVVLGVQVPGSVAGPVAGEHDPVVAGVYRCQVVVPVGLARHLVDPWRFVLSQPCHLMELPERRVAKPPAAARIHSHDHAEDYRSAVPVDAWVAYRDRRQSLLDGAGPVARRCRQVLQ